MRLAALAVAAALALPVSAHGQANTLAIAGPAVTLPIVSTTLGGPGTGVGSTTGSATITFSTPNQGSFYKITAQLAAPLPSGVSATIRVTSTQAGTAVTSTQTLSASSVIDLVTSIPSKSTSQSATVSYSVQPTLARGVATIGVSLVIVRTQ